VRPLSVAVNVDQGEADLAPLDSQELVAAITAAPNSVRTGGGGTRDVQLRRTEQERVQGIWRMLLLMAFVVLIVETALSNRLSRLAGKRGIHA
jgi:hypothetical protein